MEVVSLNVRGLNNQSKCSTIFHWLKQKGFGITCLQETFCTENNEKQVSQNWEGDIYHSLSNSCHSRGVAILLSKTFQYELLNQYQDNDGRKLLLNIKHNDQVYTIVNIYAPNEINHRKDFIHKIRPWIIERAMNTNCMFICGDFNTSLENIDRKFFYSYTKRCLYRLVRYKLQD